MQIVFSLLVCLCVLAPVPAWSADQAMVKFLPAPACTDGWVMDGKVQLYDKDSLFDRINGESELYFPYGFTALAYARYQSEKDTKVAIDLDVYAMGSPLDAFGIFANYRRKDSSEVMLGEGGIASPSQVLFHQERYFVRLQVTGAATLDQGPLTACARAIAMNLPRSPGRPRELDVLNVPGVQLASLRYIAGSLLGYEFLGRGLIADVHGEAGQVFFAPGIPPVPETAFGRYRDHLTRTGKDVQMGRRKEGMSLSAVDPLYGDVLVRETGKGLIGVVKIRDRSAAQKVLDSVGSRLAKEK